MFCGDDLHVPDVKIGADEYSRQTALQSHGVDGPVQMNGEKEGVSADQLKSLGRVDDAMAEGGDEGFVGIGEDGLLKDAFDLPIQLDFYIDGKAASLSACNSTRLGVTW